MEGESQSTEPEKIMPAGERPELIKSSCVIFGGEEFEAKTHTKAWEIAYAKYGFPLPIERSKDGFKTTRGKFVDRYEAFTLARANGQLTEKAAREKTGSNEKNRGALDHASVVFRSWRGSNIECKNA